MIIKKIKSFLLIAVMALSFGAPVLVPASVSAVTCSPIASGVSRGAEGAATGTPTDTCGNPTGVDEGGITRAARGIVNLFSLIVGIVAVIMIIYGGFRYITSGGDSGRVGTAKNSLIYAIVGLIIVALAQLIVRFVLNQSAGLTT